MARSLERKSYFLQECCSRTMKDQSEKRVGRASDKRKEQTVQRKARLSTEIPIKVAMHSNGISVWKSDCNTYHEVDNQWHQGRIIYNTGCKHPRLTDLYPSEKGDIFDGENEVWNSYEWQVFLMNKWRPFKHSIGRKIEELFWCTPPRDRELMRKRLKSDWWRADGPGKIFTFTYKHYKICPLFMMQRNMKSGKFRQIRREKIETHFTEGAMEKCYPRRRNQYSRQPQNAQYKMLNRTTKRNPRGYERKRISKARSHIEPKLIAKKTTLGVFQDDIWTRNEKVRQNSVLTSSCSLVSCKSWGVVEYNDVRTWSTKEVINWLQRLNLGRYSGVFEDNRVNGQELASASLPWLVMELGIPREHSKQILNAFQELISVYINQYSETNSLSLKGARRSTTSPSLYSLHSEKSKDSGMRSIISWNNAKQYEEISSRETESVLSAEAATPFRYRNDYSTELEYSFENASSTEEISKDTQTDSVHAFNSPCSESQYLVRKYQKTPGSTKIYIGTTEEETPASKVSNKSNSIQEQNKMYAQFMSEKHIQDVRTDRDSYEVPAPEEHKWPTQTGDSNPHWKLLPELQTTVLTIPPNVEDGDESIGHNEQKKTPALAATYSSTCCCTSSQKTDFNLGRESSETQEIENYANSSSLGDSSSESSSESSSHTNGKWPYGESMSTLKFIRELESINPSNGTSSYRVARSLMISFPKLEDSRSLI